MNPNADSMKTAMAGIIKNKMRSALCDEDNIAAHKASMFNNAYGNAARTEHHDIAPPEVRINQYKRQTFGKKLNEKINEVKREDARLLQ